MGEPRIRGYRFGKGLGPLSPEEKRILELLLTDGATNKEIAAATGKSVETVKRQIACVMDKTGYGSRLELVVRTLQERYRPTHCVCGLVRKVYPRAFEKYVPATERTTARFEIYDGEPENRCLGRSLKSFSAAWRMAAATLPESPC